MLSITFQNIVFTAQKVLMVDESQYLMHNEHYGQTNKFVFAVVSKKDCHLFRHLISHISEIIILHVSCTVHVCSVVNVEKYTRISDRLNDNLFFQ